jgi:hypothetical protein
VSKELKLCKDCKHCRPYVTVNRHWLFRYPTTMEINYEYAKCAAANINPVDGSASSYCNTERAYPANKCGPEGKLFEPEAT